MSSATPESTSVANGKISSLAIFLSRMVMCRKAAEVIGYKFTLSVNGTYLE